MGKVAKSFIQETAEFPEQCLGQLASLLPLKERGIWEVANCGHLLQPVEDAIQQTLIPNITGRTPCSREE